MIVHLLIIVQYILQHDRFRDANIKEKNKVKYNAQDFF